MGSPIRRQHRHSPLRDLGLSLLCFPHSWHPSLLLRLPPTRVLSAGIFTSILQRAFHSSFLQLLERQAVLGRSSSFCQVDIWKSGAPRRLKAKEWVLSWRFLYHPGLLGVLFQRAPVICSLDYYYYFLLTKRKRKKEPHVYSLGA